MTPNIFGTHRGAITRLPPKRIARDTTNEPELPAHAHIARLRRLTDRGTSIKALHQSLSRWLELYYNLNSPCR